MEDAGFERFKGLVGVGGGVRVVGDVVRLLDIRICAYYQSFNVFALSFVRYT